MNLAERIAFFEQKHALNPHSRVFAPLADLYREDGRYPEAVALLEAGLEEHPRYISALVILGRCLAESGEIETAQISFQKVLELDPDNLVVLKLLAEEAAAQEDWAKATKLLERVVLLDSLDETSAALLARFRDFRQAHSGGEAAVAEVSIATPAPVVELPEAAAQEPEAESLIDATELEPADETASTTNASAAVLTTEEPAPTRDSQDGGESISADGPPTVTPGTPIGKKPSSQKRKPPSKRGPFLATKTLAEIYLAQGYRDRALAVLKEILAQHPERTDIKAKIDELEQELAPRVPGRGVTHAPDSDGGDETASPELGDEAGSPTTENAGGDDRSPADRIIRAGDSRPTRQRPPVRGHGQGSDTISGPESGQSRDHFKSWIEKISRKPEETD
ncbi:MAG: tetratricopeptide repeat protein [bacterium]